MIHFLRPLRLARIFQYEVSLATHAYEPRDGKVK